nr:uncharacterized protein CTRU02_00357 [Colletotrichum truncatum]KAF6801608.1 integral membrane protein [Colletotrichum truncatum]
MQRTIWITTAGLFIIVTQATAQVTSRSSPPSTTELLSTTPGCAIPCFVEGYHTGNCTIGDLTDCICTNIPLQAQVSACVQKSCEFEDQVARLKVTSHLWWDDWTALVALFFLLVLSACGFANILCNADGVHIHASIWDRSIEGQCLNISAIGYAGAACSILEDVVLFVIPIPELLKLQLSRKKKIALVFMFSVASFACIASMIRLKYMVSYANTYDATWDNVEIVLWSSIELNSAIVCGSLPALLPLFRIVSGYFSRIMTTMQSKHHRRPEEPIDEGKESFSQASGTSSEASSPQKSIRAKTFGNVSAANDLRIVGHMSARTDGRDDLEHQDWITGRSTS